MSNNANEITLKIDGKDVDYVRKDSIEHIQQGDAYPYQIGKPYHIRTVTFSVHGVLVAVTPSELVLKDAAWIADSGRFGAYAAGSEPSEVEPFPDGQVIIGRGAVVDAFVRSGSFRVVK